MTYELYSEWEYYNSEYNGLPEVSLHRYLLSSTLLGAGLRMVRFARGVAGLFRSPHLDEYAQRRKEIAKLLQ